MSKRKPGIWIYCAHCGLHTRDEITRWELYDDFSPNADARDWKRRGGTVGPVGTESRELKIERLWADARHTQLASESVTCPVDGPLAVPDLEQLRDRLRENPNQIIVVDLSCDTYRIQVLPPA